MKELGVLFIGWANGFYIYESLNTLDNEIVVGWNEEEPEIYDLKMDFRGWYFEIDNTKYYLGDFTYYE